MTDDGLAAFRSRVSPVNGHLTPVLSVDAFQIGLRSPVDSRRFGRNRSSSQRAFQDAVTRFSFGSAGIGSVPMRRQHNLYMNQHA